MYRFFWPRKKPAIGIRLEFGCTHVKIWAPVAEARRVYLVLYCLCKTPTKRLIPMILSVEIIDLCNRGRRVAQTSSPLDI